MKLIVGMGNPGRIYTNNRHNVGFQCIDYCAHLHDIKMDQRRNRSYLGTGTIAGEKVLLAKPRTFVNRSGEAVRSLVDRHRIPLSDVLVVYDDLDLPLGSIRIRLQGGAGGHNGMKSIISHLGSKEFPRIRVGIAPLTENEATDHASYTQKTKTPEYVLSDFTAQEKPVIKEAYLMVTRVISCIITEGIAKAMNLYNSR